MSNRMNILVLEDNPQARKLLEEIFSKTEVDLTEAHTIEDALIMIQASKPDLILADVNLPDGDSLRDVLPFLKKNKQTSNIPVIAMSGMDKDVLEKRSKAAGCDGFVTKPYSAMDLAASVGQCLSPEE